VAFARLHGEMKLDFFVDLGVTASVGKRSAEP
jgi:hypothetical protein